MATKTSTFGVGKREGHDASAFYARQLVAIDETTDVKVNESPVADQLFVQSAEKMEQLPDASVALMVTSPPYHVGKDYDSDATFEEYLDMLEAVFAETYRVLQPGGRAVVNVANLGRRPYVPLSHLITQRMHNVGFFMRGEVIWRKAKGASGNCAWGSWQSPSNPIIRDVHEYCLCFSKGRFDRVVKGEKTITRDEFLELTLSIWEFPPEFAKRVKHPAPFPVELPRRFIELYTYGGELVLDPFMGSGTTALAAIQTRRHWIGYDTNAEFAETARHRIAECCASRSAVDENHEAR
ncbi:MAG: SAM-dependent methyltransferase [Armatimonadetes bacterium CG2_30_59_28]|nr:site-specific DNA-methyltransferase [Armatimonadota bacterium]OIO94530.1 MAG: SAM-dependent methyltransferase [Armatimonadetes bacterium CG2_30_59_28]PIU61076.1 MAG: SAM-dependent methyltransferase [Armatimonadetes bacterium CG07_land_8_20_14_0_80_59_28]PJB78063.1 MAG: SAM-dependent methyltransferase [Armatimonadetes bacterium CG_4_9_14_3_um_filter_58_7]